MVLVTFIGLVLLALGCWMQVKVQRRNFERRNAAGVLEFDSFGQSYKHTLQNRALRGGGIAFSVLGAIMFAVGIVVTFN